MKDIKTKEVTTKPKVKNPASRIPKELMRTAILESKEKSQTIANARDNDMGEQSPSEYASGKVTSAEKWAARKIGRTVTRAGKIAAQASYEKINESREQKKKPGKKLQEKQKAHRALIRPAGKHRAEELGTGGIPCEGQRTGKSGSPDPESSAAKGNFRCRQDERTEDPGSQGDTENPEWAGDSRNEAVLHPGTEPEKSSRRYRKAECHSPETAGNHPDQGKATETVGAEDHTAAYY